MTARILARCVHGLEWVAADEVTRRLPDAAPVGLDRRAVTFGLPGLAAARLDPALLDLRTVDDVFVIVGEVDEVGTTRDALPPLARRVARLPLAGWVDAVREIRPVPRRPGFDVVASIEGRRTYNRFAVEGVTGRALAPVLGGTFLERSPQGGPAGEPDLTVRLFLRGPTATVAVRLSRRPLHRRGYKTQTGAGTLHPPLAAALCRIGAPEVAGTLLDPFCGDGTIVVEAAAVHRLVAGADLDPVRLGNAGRNAAAAGVHPWLVRADAGRPCWLGGAIAAVVTNPPWNLAVDAHGRLAGSLDPFWRRLPALLAPGGRLAALTDAGLDAPRALHRLGYPVALEAQIRLAGRVSHVVLAGRPGGRAPGLPDSLDRWRRRAIAANVVTEHGF